VTLKTPLCDLLGIDIPVMQAGMGVYRGLVTTPELVAAVSNAGGMGCLGGSGLLPSELQDAIRRIKALTARPFGVDLLLPAKLSRSEGTRDTIRREIAGNHPRHWAWAQALFDRYNLPHSQIDMEHALTPELTDAQADVVVAEQVPLFVAGLGDPGAVAARVHAYGGKVAGLIGSVRHARRQVQSGVDLLIAQGSEAGGHVGTVATMPLVPQVVDAVTPCPVVAGGGIADGRGLAAALMLGAQAVWCGTAFLFAEEAQIHPIQRDQILTGQSEDFAATRIYTGKTARTFRNEIHRLWTETGLEPLGMPHQKVLMDDFLDAARTAGRLDIVSNPSGQVAGMLHTVRSATKIVRDMIDQAAACLKHGATLVDLDASKR
jgi:NAD(P)H-dependent flavin oxidoreductase YrpB (nitropropane dioxygenase family)